MEHLERVGILFGDDFEDQFDPDTRQLKSAELSQQVRDRYRDWLGWDSLTMEERRQVLRGLIEEVRVLPDGDSRGRNKTLQIQWQPWVIEAMASVS